MTESDIFKFFTGAGLTPEGAAAVMGNLMAESGLKSTNLQNSFEKKLGMNDEQYTAAVDSGMYANFVRDGAGYGLAQWTFWSRKQKLLEYARSCGLSIGDVGMQLAFLLSEISAYGKLWSDLRTTNDIDALSDEVLTSYERPADIKGEIEKRRQYAREIFAGCTGGNPGTAATQGIDLTGNPGTTITGGGGVTANQDKTDYSAEKASGTPTKTYDNADSPLVTVTCWTTKHSGQRNQPASKITIHHMAGVASAEKCMKSHKNGARNVSANYYIGKDAEIGQAVPESCRAWTSSSGWNDHRAITIEVSNSVAADPWPISGEVYKSLIALCVDICKRNGIKEVHYTGDKDGSLTEHRMFKPTACIPVETEVLTREGWKAIKDVQLGEEIACADLDNLNISFEKVYAKVPEKKQDTYTNSGFTATKDHRMVYCGQYNREMKIDTYNKLLHSTTQIYIPMAGQSNFRGLGFSQTMERFLIAVQADGCYMYERDAQGNKRFYGVEFHLSKERKIKKLKSLISELELTYKENKKSDGTTSIRIYNQNGTNIVLDLCEKYLKNKCFTWNWIYLSAAQADIFFDEIMAWDGCIAGKKYTSRQRINLDVVSALAALNKRGSRIVKHDVQFRDTPFRTLSGVIKRHNQSSGNKYTTVTCVSVKTGIFLCRQEGRTFIIGNCPGLTIHNMLANHQIENDINALLSGTSAITTPTMNGFKVRVTISDLNIRAGAGTNHNIVGICPPGVYTIVETAQGKGSSKGWGRLKSGMGWISLGYAERI